MRLRISIVIILGLLATPSIGQEGFVISPAIGLNEVVDNDSIDTLSSSGSVIDVDIDSSSKTTKSMYELQAGYVLGSGLYLGLRYLILERTSENSTYVSYLGSDERADETGKRTTTFTGFTIGHHGPNFIIQFSYLPSVTDEASLSATRVSDTYNAQTTTKYEYNSLWGTAFDVAYLVGDTIKFGPRITMLVYKYDSRKELETLDATGGVLTDSETQGDFEEQYLAPMLHFSYHF